MVNFAVQCFFPTGSSSLHMVHRWAGNLNEEAACPMAEAFHEHDIASATCPKNTCIVTPPGAVLVVFAGMVGGVGLRPEDNAGANRVWTWNQVPESRLTMDPTVFMRAGFIVERDAEKETDLKGRRAGKAKRDQQPVETKYYCNCLPGCDFVSDVPPP